MENFDLIWLYPIVVVAGIIWFVVWGVFLPGPKCESCDSRKGRNELSEEFLSEKLGQQRRTYTSTEHKQDGLLNSQTTTHYEHQLVPVMRRKYRVKYECKKCGAQTTEIETVAHDEF